MYDDIVLDAFLEQQGRLFDEDVASNREEAEEFLEDCMAVVVKGRKQVIEYFDDIGCDFDEEDILEQAEVFDIGDGRFLIVEG